MILAFLLSVPAVVITADIVGQIRSDRLHCTGPRLPQHLAAAYKVAPVLRYVAGWEPPSNGAARQAAAATHAEICAARAELWATHVLDQLHAGHKSTPAMAVYAVQWLPTVPAGTVLSGATA